MRDSVNSPWFRFRKVLDNTLHRLMPSAFMPLYSMVTFSQIPYATVIARHRRQEKWVSTALTGLTAAGVLAAGVALYRRFGPLNISLRF